MTDYRRLTGAFIAALGLVLTTSYAFAQQPDRGDEPGLVADDDYQLDPKWQKHGGVLPHHRAAGHDHRLDRRALSLSGAAGRARAALRHRRRPRRLPVAGPGEDHQQEGMAGLDAAAGDDPAPALSAALHGRRPRQSARRPRACISAPRSTASTAPTSRRHIGTAVSSGCFRLVNPDVADLYDRVPVGTKVIIRQQPEV